MYSRVVGGNSQLRGFIGLFLGFSNTKTAPLASHVAGCDTFTVVFFKGWGYRKKSARA
jgi:hypothetical protein